MISINSIQGTQPKEIIETKRPSGLSLAGFLGFDTGLRPYSTTDASPTQSALAPASSERLPRFPPPEVKIWKIIYPEDIQPRPEYLAKQFNDVELYNSWMFGK